MANVVITRGMANVLITPQTNVKVVCQECGLVVPRYRGKYPANCPSCHTSFLAITQESHQAYYKRLCEVFTSQVQEIARTHDFSRERVYEDLTRQMVLPYLLELREVGFHKGIFETLYTGLCQLTRRPHDGIFPLFEAASCGSFSTPAWSFLAAKTLSVYTPLLLELGEVRKITATAERIVRHRPDWWTISPNALLPESRQRQILAEAYAFVRPHGTHEESVAYAGSTLLTEAMWVSQLPPSSVLHPRKKGDRRPVVGGFRFRVGGEDPQGKTKEIHRRIASKKNKSGGVGTTITSARKVLQRRIAQRKATAWHRTNPNSPRLHKGLGQLLHRSKGRYKPTQEGYRGLKHIKESENSLRLFSDGSEYYTGQVFSFKLDLGEGTKLMQTATPDVQGALFIRTHGMQITEVVISAFDRLLSEAQVANILHACRCAVGDFQGRDIPVRVYNDEPSLVLLKEELERNKRLTNLRIMEECETFVLYEVDDEKKQAVEDQTKTEIESLKQRHDTEIAAVKARASENQQELIQNLKMRHASHKEKIGDKKKLALTRLKETTGGPGGRFKTLEGEVLGRDLIAHQTLRLTPGTEARHTTLSTGEEQVDVLSGPFAGRRVLVMDSTVFPTTDFARIHEHYREIL